VRYASTSTIVFRFLKDDFLVSLRTTEDLSGFLTKNETDSWLSWPLTWILRSSKSRYFDCVIQTIEPVNKSKKKIKKPKYIHWMTGGVVILPIMSN
jgi:hypothetical protein